MVLIITGMVVVVWQSFSTAVNLVNVDCFKLR